MENAINFAKEEKKLYIYIYPTLIGRDYFRIVFVHGENRMAIVVKSKSQGAEDEWRGSSQ